MDLSREIYQELQAFISPEKVEMFDRIASERTNYITVAMENIHHDHNASAVLRTCDCFGVQQLHTIEKDHQYKIQREIARGAGKWVDIYNYNEGPTPVEDCIKKLKTKGYQIIATTPHEEDCNIADLPIDQPTAIVFGTEWTGISEEMIQLADGFVKIPMYGFTESFNVSVSAALVLQELRNRLAKSSIDYLLTENEQTELKIKWASKIIKNGEQVTNEIRKRLLEKQK